MLVTNKEDVPRKMVDDIHKLLNGPLPGLSGQLKMAPEPANETVNRWDVPDNCRNASVLLLLYPISKDEQAELHFALTRRPEYPGVHGGQISFPGGRREKGETPEETALRETHEEIGVSPDTLEIVGQLSSLYIPPSNFCISPFVAFCPIQPTFELDVIEVAELIETPLSLLLDPTIRKSEIWHFENFGERKIPFFEIFGHKVWGATAMILSEFLALLENKFE